MVFVTFAQILKCFNALRRADIESSTAHGDARLDALRDWISAIDAVAGCEPVPASSDASFRRYFRLQAGGNSYIVMDAPPEKEDSRPYVRVAGFLESMRLNAPRVLEADLDKGFLLLSDLGTREYLEVLEGDPGSVARLYDDALRALRVLQASGVAFQGLLPLYDEVRFRVEMSLFRDWLCGTHLDIEFDNEAEHSWSRCCDMLVAHAIDQPQVFVHRDYHSRNLMFCEHDNPGILDFQDAMEGPLTYDLVSLLKDCYVKWPTEQVREWALQFYRGLDNAFRQRMPEAGFLRSFDLMGVQRHLKAAGIFARLNHRDGKSGFLNDIPRTLSYIVDLGPRYPELDFLVSLIETRVLPAMDAGS